MAEVEDPLRGRAALVTGATLLWLGQKRNAAANVELRSGGAVARFTFDF